MRHLAQDAHAAVLVGDRVIDLDASVHRTGVQHDGMGSQTRGAFGSEPK